MSKEKVNDLRKVVAEVSEDVLISLKILSLKRRVTLGTYVTEVLNKHVVSKSKVIETAENIEE